MAVTVAPAPGTQVNYHGSVVDYHGLCTVDQVCGYCTRCWGHDRRVRLTHIDSGEPLCCVRLESISLPDATGPRKAAE